MRKQIATGIAALVLVLGFATPGAAQVQVRSAEIGLTAPRQAIALRRAFSEAVIEQRVDGGVRLNGVTQGITINNPTFTGQAKFASGSASAPSIAPSNALTSGFFWQTNSTLLTSAGTPVWGSDASQGLVMKSTLPFAWSSGDPSVSGADTGISRLGAASIGLGNGSQGSTTASLTFAAAALNNKIVTYNAISTAGWGVSAIQAAGRSTAQTAAVASVAAYTVGAADGSFEISANVLVTTATTHTFTIECAYTDEGNTARTVTLTFEQLAGTLTTSVTNTNGAVPYEGVPFHIRAKAATSITIRTQAAGVYTAVVYNVEGIIKQTA